MSECRLLSCPPVGETMHSVGHCYCHLCTCGQHPCPSKPTSKQFLPSALSSSYKKDYPKKSAILSEPFLPPSPNLSSPKRDFLSTNQADFVIHPPSKTPSAKYEKQLITGLLKFKDSTSYKSEFPDWGHYEFIHVGRYQRSASKKNLEFSPVTTYSKDFQGMEGGRTRSQKRINERSPILQHGEFDGMTMNKKTFKPPSREDFARRASNKNFGIVGLESPKNAYDTLYRNDFKRKVSPPLPAYKKTVQGN